MRIRTSFASPFVITIAACSTPASQQKPEPVTKGSDANLGSAIASGSADPGSGSSAGPVGPPDAGVVAAPDPVTYSLFAQNGKCTVMDDRICRYSGKQPAPPCNPPPPQKYKCPPGFPVNGNSKIVIDQYNQCQTRLPPPPCTAAPCPELPLFNVPCPGSPAAMPIAADLWKIEHVGAKCKATGCTDDAHCKGPVVADYECNAIAPKGTFFIHQYGMTCSERMPPMTCPPNVSCNPPPPKMHPCPQPDE